jgi:hypothetical protein
MDAFRITARNNINNDIKQAENVIKRNKETIERLKGVQTNIEFNRNQIEKLSVLEKEYQEKLKTLKQKYIDIGVGLYDEEFLKDKEESELKFKKDKEKLDVKYEKKETQKILNKEILDNEYKMRRHEGPSDFHIKKETDRFFKSVNTIPNFILDNLKNMPSNKGYIWRGVHCYGELPPESKNVIMFEKCKNGLMKIHECFSDKILIYEKVGKGPKILLKTIMRDPLILEETKRVISSLGF